MRIACVIAASAMVVLAGCSQSGSQQTSANAQQESIPAVNGTGGPVSSDVNQAASGETLGQQLNELENADTAASNATGNSSDNSSSTSSDNRM